MLKEMTLGQIKDAAKRGVPVVLRNKDSKTGKTNSTTGSVYYFLSIIDAWVIEFNSEENKHPTCFLVEYDNDTDVWRHDTDVASYTFVSCQTGNLVPLRASELLNLLKPHESLSFRVRIENPTTGDKYEEMAACTYHKKCDWIEVEFIKEDVLRFFNLYRQDLVAMGNSLCDNIPVSDSGRHPWKISIYTEQSCVKADILQAPRLTGDDLRNDIFRSIFE